MKTSIVFCTARRGGLDILDHCLSKQTYKDFEVIIMDELKRDHVFFQHLPRFNGKERLVKFINPPKKKPDMFWNLNASLNAGVRVATGDLIILLQDYIWVPPTGIHQFVNKAHVEWPCLISGVGHQYKEPGKAYDLMGEFSIWNQFPGEPRGDITFEDPRLNKAGFYVCNPVEWEANWSCFSKEIWQAIGGFDEEFDKGWGYDNVNFSERAQLAGYNVFIDTENEVKCYDHINIFGENDFKTKAPNNQKLWHVKYRDLHKGSKQWKLNYA